MSGTSSTMFFYRIYKGAGGDARLGKVPGDLLEDFALGELGYLWSQYFQGVVVDSSSS